jgi:hypothetical protein
MLDEWLFTPMRSRSQRSSASLFWSPSSLASSYTRILLLAMYSFFFFF